MCSVQLSADLPFPAEQELVQLKLVGDEVKKVRRLVYAAGRVKVFFVFTNRFSKPFRGQRIFGEVGSEISSNGVLEDDMVDELENSARATRSPS